MESKPVGENRPRRKKSDVTPLVGATPMGGMGMETPSAAQLAASMAGAAGAPMTPEQYNAMRWEREIEERNRPLTDDDLDGM